MSAQQMAVVPGSGSGVCECPARQKKIAQHPADTAWQLIDSGSCTGSSLQGREAQGSEYKLIIENVGYVGLPP